jgi:N-methylhydantoinase A
MTRSAGELHLGVDVGGTFTDLCVTGDGRVRIGKVPTRVDDPFGAILAGLDQIGLDISDVSAVAFGTTLATNILIERSGAKTALLCTEGFSDVLEHQRWHRRHLYDLQQTRPAPLVTRHLRIGMHERLASDGEVLVELDPEAVAGLVGSLKREGVESVAVCFLNSYRDSHNEAIAGRALREAADGLYVSLSSDIAPLIREWERTSTTVTNAYVQPVMDRHLSELRTSARGASPDLGLHVMQSNGGVISVEQAASEPVRTILSGPAAGVMGGLTIGDSADEPNLVLMDMGGTSCDVAVIQDGAPQVSKEGEADYNLPISIPMLDIHTIGAGGGSIVSIDSGGALKVGPESAGAVPGPACYGRGGATATVTDAQLQLGRLSAEGGLLAGQMSLQPDQAQAALAGVAEWLEMPIETLAAGVVRIANVKMAEAIRMITVNRGLDPRAFSLLAFGGAGPLHGCEIANELDIPRILIPASAGVLSAAGLAGAAVKTGAVKALNVSLDAISSGAIEAEFAELEQRVHALLGEHDVPAEERTLERSADARYRHQSFEIAVPVAAGAADAVAGDFHAAHEALYQYSRTEEVPFLVNIEVSAQGQRQSQALWPLADAAGDPEPAGSRDIFVLDDAGWATVPVFQRETLLCGHRIEGPAVVDQLDSTVVILPGWVADVDRFGTMILTREDAES